ncbi:MAG: hypothetical protein ACUVQP_02040 [Bacteroidales bacterium]
MRQIIVILLSFLLLFSLFSFRKPVKVSEIPQIKFIDIPIKDTLDKLGNPIRRATLIYSLIDGDGDIGFQPSDTLPPFNYGSIYYYNVYIDLYKNVNNQQVIIPLQTPFYFRTKYIQPQGINKVLQCTLKVDMDFNLPTNIDSCEFVFYMYDRAQHKSNIERSGYRKLMP